MKRTSTVALLCAMLFCLVLSACGSAGLADGFDNKQVTEQAEAAVSLTNGGDYDALVSSFRSDLQKQLTADTFKSAWSSQLKDAGAFKSFKSTAVYGTKDKSTGEDYAVAVIVAEYENAAHTFTISVDKDGKLVGMYMK